jgi:hypothetical protein
MLGIARCDASKRFFCNQQEWASNPAAPTATLIRGIVIIQNLTVLLPWNRFEELSFAIAIS